MEIHDLAPSRGGLVVVAPTHNARATLALRGLTGAITMKAAFYRPVFLPVVDQAVQAVAEGKLEEWPETFPLEGSKPPDAAAFHRARAAFAAKGERGLFETLNIDLMKFIDVSQGRQGWVPKDDARYGVVIVEEAGQIPREQIEDLKRISDLVILLGDFGQNKPIVKAEELAQRGDDLSGLFSSLHPESLEALGASEVLRLHKNYRSVNRIADVPAITDAAGTPTDVFRWMETLPEDERACFSFSCDPGQPPLEPMLRGAPLYLLSHKDRLWQNLLFLERAGLITEYAEALTPLVPGVALIVKSIRSDALKASGPVSLVSGSRWFVREVDPQTQRCNIENASRPGEFIHGVAINLREFKNKDVEAFEATHGAAYPELGVPWHRADIGGVLGHVLVYANAQSSTMPEVIVETSGIRWKAWKRLIDADGSLSWKTDLVTCVGRAQHVAHLWSSR